MTTKEALIGFYNFNKLNLKEDFKSHCVRVYIGCLLTPVPNIKARKKYLKFHDLHHIITNYSIDRIGESEVSAWELGSRSCRKPLILIMNLFALSTGFVLAPKRVWKAYKSGCLSKNTYYLVDTKNEKEINENNIEKLKSSHFEIKQNIKFKRLRQIEFIFYLFFSFIIHTVMLVAGKLLITAEKIKKQINLNNK